MIDTDKAMASKKNENKPTQQADGIQAGELTLRNVTVKDAGRSLTSVYARERKKLFEPFAVMVRDGLLRASKASSTKMQGYMSELQMTDGLDLIPDTGQTQLYNSFGADLRNVLAVAKADRRYDDAWRWMITHLETNSVEIRKQLGREINVASGYSWSYTKFVEILFSPLTVIDIWEVYTRGYRDYIRIGQLSMGVSTRCALSDLFFGPGLRMPHLSKDLPEGTRLMTEDFEQYMATDLMMLEGIALNGSMLAANGSMSAAALKKVKAQTNIRDFMPTAEKWPLDRVELLCLTFFTLKNARRSDDKSAIDIKQLAKFAVDRMPRWIVGPMFSAFLPAMQGFSKSWTENSYTWTMAENVEYILADAKDDWMSLDNFKMLLLCSPKEGEHNFEYLKLFFPDARRKGKPVRKSDKEMGVVQPETIDWGEEIGLRFAIHWIKYMCAMGLLEIAMDADGNVAADDPMEGMRYARLTPLGRYALNIDADYTPKAAEGSTEVEFDAQNGIITIGAASPFQMFMNRIAKKISPTRFRISVDSLLGGCRNASDLEQRITNLRTVIDPEKEPALKKLIDDAKEHTFCATRDGGYSLLRLRHDLPGLRELLLTNKELREMTILAGPALALVKTHKMERFNAICAANGFLME